MKPSMKEWLKAVRFFILFLWGGMLFPTLACTEIRTIEIDASKRTQSIPKLFSASIWLGALSKENEYIVRRYLEDMRPATIQHSLPGILRDSSDMEDFKQRLVDYVETDLFGFVAKKVKEYDTLFIIGFDPGAMPQWLSKHSGNKNQRITVGTSTIEMTSPPKDNDQWGNVVAYTIEVFKRKGITRLGFYVGHEPNAHEWTGSEDSFFRYYAAAARAVKRVDGSVLVGGIGTWHIDAWKLACSDESTISEEARRICMGDGNWGRLSSMTKNFIEYVAANKLPLDFINWHSFGTYPGEFMYLAKRIRQWLSNANITQPVYLYVSDWTYWKNPYPADYLDTSETSAYVISALATMWRAGIDIHGYDFDVRNYEQEDGAAKKLNDATFIGDWSQFTRHGVIKPVYNAFRALTLFAESKRHMIEVRNPNDLDITALGAIGENGEKLSIILSYFAPSKERLTLRRLSEMVARSSSPTLSILAEYVEAIKECGERKRVSREEGHFKRCVEEMKSQVGNQMDKEVLGFLDQLVSCIPSPDPLPCIKGGIEMVRSPLFKREISALVDDFLQPAAPIQFKLKIKGLGFAGKCKIISYTVDSEHSNACTVNKKTEVRHTSLPCGINGEIDKKIKQARITADERAEKAVADLLLKRGYPAGQIEQLLDNVKDCRANRLIGSRRSMCLELVVKTVGRQNAQDVHSLYQETRRRIFCEEIDRINKFSGISLLGSQQVRHDEVTNGEYADTIMIMPNSVLLVELSREK